MEIGFLSPKVGSAQQSQPFLPCAAKAMYRPSRDQSVADLLVSSFKRAFSSPWPLDGFSKRSYVPLRSDRNTMVAPSGDHTGFSLLAPPNVKRELTPRARS